MEIKFQLTMNDKIISTFKKTEGGKIIGTPRN